MSQRRQIATRALMELGMIMIIALLAPLIISFIIYIVASGFGAATLPAVGYGVQCVLNSNGVCTLWVVPATGSGSSTNVSLPSVIVNVLNSFLILISIIVAIIAGIRLAPKLLEMGGDE